MLTEEAAVPSTPYQNWSLKQSLSNNNCLVVIFLDLKGACDCVNLKTLRDSLLSVGCTINVGTNIVELYRNRTIYIRDHNNVLHGPCVVATGLPQGYILAPILFNIYTTDLHTAFPKSIGVIQYSDDICLYTSRLTIDNCIEDLKTAMRILNTWICNKNFCLSPEKSAAMIFSRHRKDHIIDNIMPTLLLFASTNT